MSITKKLEKDIMRCVYEGIEYDGKTYVMIDLLDDSEKVLDTIIRDENGFDVLDPSIAEQVEEIVNLHQI